MKNPLRLNLTERQGETAAFIPQPSLHTLKLDSPAGLRRQRRWQHVGQSYEQSFTWGLLPLQSPCKTQHRHLQRRAGETLSCSSRRHFPFAHPSTPNTRLQSLYSISHTLKAVLHVSTHLSQCTEGNTRDILGPNI